MLEPAKLSYLATEQLAAWEKLAANWPLYVDGPCGRCASCHVNVIRLVDEQGISYVYTDEQLLALKVAHLRQAHMDLDPDR